MSAMQPSSFADWMRHGRLAPYARQITALDGLCSLIEAHQPAGDMSDPPVGDLVFTMIRSPDLRGRTDLGDGRFDVRAPRGSLFVIPPDFATDIQLYVPHALRIVAIPASRLTPLVGEARPGDAPLHFGRLHRGDLDSPLLKDLMDRIWRVGAGPEPTTRLWMEAAVMMATAELARLSGEAVRPARGGLAPHVLRRVRERMLADLAEDLGLEELSHLAALSPFHFLRAFKQSTGLPPQAWRQQARLEAARQLLASTTLPVTDIALQVGYESSQALARAFRSRLGTTPTAYRRNRSH
jgi:AraC family transcriptional regulator